jgi:hypothetical protein
MSPRHWFLTFLLAGCAWAIGYYMGGDAVPGELPVSDAIGSGSTLGDSSNASRRAGGTSEGDTAAEPIPQALLLSRVRTVLENPSARWRREQLTNMLRSVPIAEIPEFLAQLKGLSRADRDEISSLLLTHWAAERPRDAMEFAFRMDVGVAAVLAEWTAADPMSATAWVKALPGGPGRDGVISSFIPNLARRDPQGAFQIMMKENEAHWDHLGEVMARWAQKDLAAAAVAAESVPSGMMAPRGAAAVAENWAKTDPAKALEWSLRFGNPDIRRQAVGAALAEWAKSDPEAALKRVAEFPSDLDRNSALAILVSAMVEKDPDRAAAVAEQLPMGSDRQRAMHDLAFAFAGKDPRRAAVFAEQINPDWNTDEIVSVLITLSSKDPKVASELALKLDRKSGSRRPVLGIAFADWMGREPTAALDWLTRNELPQMSGSGVGSAVAQWAKEHVEDARALAETSRVPAVLNGALHGILEKDPATAARLAMARGADEVDAHVWRLIGQSKANQDAAEAAEWLKQLPANRAQEEATSGVIQSWVSKDTAAAATWIDRLQLGDLRDRATNVFAHQISRQDPVGALTWANSIQKEETRNRVMVDVLRSWSERNLSAAREWANTQPNLPADVREDVPQLQVKK